MNTKFSEFAEGGELQPTDTIVGLRSGANTKFNASVARGAVNQWYIDGVDGNNSNTGGFNSQVETVAQALTLVTASDGNQEQINRAGNTTETVAIELNPFVNIIGDGSIWDVSAAGFAQLDPSWETINTVTVIENHTIAGDFTLDFSALTAGDNTLVFRNCYIVGEVTLKGYSAGSSWPNNPKVYFDGCRIGSINQGSGVYTSFINGSDVSTYNINSEFVGTDDRGLIVVIDSHISTLNIELPGTSSLDVSLSNAQIDTLQVNTGGTVSFNRDGLSIIQSTSGAYDLSTAFGYYQSGQYFTGVSKYINLGSYTIPPLNALLPEQVYYLRSGFTGYDLTMPSTAVQGQLITVGTIGLSGSGRGGPKIIFPSGVNVGGLLNLSVGSNGLVYSRLLNYVDDTYLERLDQTSNFYQRITFKFNGFAWVIEDNYGFIEQNMQPPPTNATAWETYQNITSDFTIASWPFSPPPFRIWNLLSPSGSATVTLPLITSSYQGEMHRFINNNPSATAWKVETNGADSEFQGNLFNETAGNVTVSNIAPLSGVTTLTVQDVTKQGQSLDIVCTGAGWQIVSSFGWG